MDYSLLMAIEKVPEEGPPAVDAPGLPDFLVKDMDRPSVKNYRSNSMVSNNRHRFVSSCGTFIYHLAIIDYLQAFNFDKWSESRFKIYFLRRPKDLISAVDPDIYGDRFISFMKEQVLLDSILDVWHKDNSDEARE